MAVPNPPRIEILQDVATIANALKALQHYLTQVYNAVRPAVLRTEEIGEVADVSETTFAAISPAPGLTLSVSNPPTQAEVIAIGNAVNAVVTTVNQILIRQQAIEIQVVELQNTVNAILEASRTEVSAN